MDDLADLQPDWRRHLRAQGMPTTAHGIHREHLEARPATWLLGREESRAATLARSLGLTPHARSKMESRRWDPRGDDAMREAEIRRLVEAMDRLPAEGSAS